MTTQSALFSLLPISDGPIIDDQLSYLLGNGTLPNDVPLLIGTVADEGQVFIGASCLFLEGES